MSIGHGRWTFSALRGDPNVQRWHVLCDEQRCSHRRWLEALRDDADARHVSFVQSHSAKLQSQSRSRVRATG
jgi:hypothetical protein